MAGVKHLYAGRRAADFSELVQDLPPEVARKCYLESAPEFSPTARDSDSGLVLYQSGRIRSVPAIYRDSNADLQVDDQKWLIHQSIASGPNQVTDDAKRAGRASRLFSVAFVRARLR